MSTPPGRYLANIGPDEGIVPYRFGAPVGVHVDVIRMAADGVATPCGVYKWGNQFAQAWRLRVKGVALEGEWIILDRAFVRMGDAAEVDLDEVTLAKDVGLTLPLSRDAGRE